MRKESPHLCVGTWRMGFWVIVAHKGADVSSYLAAHHVLLYLLFFVLNRPHG